MIAIGILARRGQVSRPGSEAMTDSTRSVRQCEGCAPTFPRRWVELEPNGYPQAFVEALTGAGWLAALIPEEYGGAGLPLAGNHEFGDFSTS